MCDPVSASNTSTLTAPTPRLPLGTNVESAAGDTEWTVWIPSNVSGKLVVERRGASLVRIKGKGGQQVAKGTEAASYDVPMDGHGEHLVTVKGGGTSVVRATFVQTHWSRQAAALDAEPLVPYNFYYWPALRSGLAAAEAVKTLRRYAEAVKKSPQDAEAFEVGSHQADQALDWEGHCHLAAPASAFFRRPEKGFRVSSGCSFLEFDEPEAALLATEFWANFGELDYVWRMLASSSSTKPTLVYHFKPDWPKTWAAAAHAARMAELNNPDGAAANWVHVLGGEAGLKDEAERQFGTAAATFFNIVLSKLAKNGEPLIGDMRSYNPGAGPRQVWNQVYFWFEASYTETPNSKNKLDMTIDLDMCANLDDRGAVGLPATVTGKWSFSPWEVKPKSSPGECLRFRYKIRLLFDAIGAIEVNNVGSRWISAKNSSGGDLYVPKALGVLKKAQKVRRSAADPWSVGNPVVGLEFLGYLDPHDRFR